MTERAAALDAFLATAGWGDAERRPLPGDASFRRYVRLVRGNGTAMVMDAPPPKEDVGPYLSIARWLVEHGYSAPRVLAEDQTQGFLLLEDFGDSTFTRELARGADERQLYALAVDVLADMHRRQLPSSAPPYDDGRLLAEAALLLDWYMPAVLGRTVTDAERGEYCDIWRSLFPIARRVPNVLVLRDFHVDNLMVLPGRGGIASCGLLDFQDAVVGPLSYDLVSLLEDARRDIAPALVAEMRGRYEAALPKLDRASFAASYAIMGAQRNAKIIGIFTRLCRRDHKPHYLRHIPRVWRLLEGDLRHPALAPMARWLDAHIPPERRAVPSAAPRPLRAMVLAAGKGERLRPITEATPKPLVAVGGRTMLDRALDALQAAGIERAVVNTHHLGAQIEAHAARRTAPPIVISREDVLLETGGGVAKALPLLGPGAFYVLNGDVIWTDGAEPALNRLAAAWREGEMDALLLLQPKGRATGYDGRGDFEMDAAGRLTRSKEGAAFVFAGVQILHPRLFEGAPDAAFSLNVLFDRAIARRRLFGLVHDGLWLHVGTVPALAEAERALA